MRGGGPRAKKAWDIFLDRNVSWYKNAKVRIGTQKESPKREWEKLTEILNQMGKP